MNKCNICLFMISPCIFPPFLQELQFSFLGILCSLKFMDFTHESEWAEHLSYIYLPKTFLLVVAPSHLFCFLPLLFKLVFTSTQEVLHSNLLIKEKTPHT